ncbi:hypothetical protein B0H34DRAFT_654163 [Crassisporium funariophilum]|nr:hypothetical protein B0H34DRAFT_654163 [Crassisporium funariophilum]
MPAVVYTNLPDKRLPQSINVCYILRFYLPKVLYHPYRTPAPEEDSIFTSEEKAWSRIFEDLDEKPKLDTPFRKVPNTHGVLSPGGRQTMTARETKVLTGMLDMIFQSSDQEIGADSQSHVGIGRGKVDDLFGRLRRHSKRVKWMNEPDADLLDKKKEQLSFCSTDQELLDWAIREVFEESKKYEETAKLALTETANSLKKKVDLPMLQPPTYPHMVALLMRTFRDKYRDPHVALSIFNYAQNLSIVSYVFGCSTEAYNELIETRWTCFRDMKGVHDALQEMLVNGVSIDSKTRKLVEILRQDVGGHLDQSDDNRDEVWNTLVKIERSIAAYDADRGTQTMWDQWKSDVVNNTEADDGWGFDNWEKKSDISKRKRRY